MNDDIFGGSDPAFARLRAADPAGQAQPDLGAIRAAVDARITATPVDEVAVRRSRRGSKRPWLMGAAAVAAGAVLIGSSGFALGTVAASSGPAKSAKAIGATSNFVPSNMGGLQTGSPLDLSHRSLSSAPQFAPSKSSTIDASGHLSVTAEAGAGTSIYVPSGTFRGTQFVLTQPAPGTVFAASSTLDLRAGLLPAYAYRPTLVDPVVVTKKLALALGDRHKVVLSSDSQSYVAKTRYQDLTVHVDGTLSFNFSDQTPDGTDCKPLYGARSVVGATGVLGNGLTPTKFPDLNTCYASQTEAQSTVDPRGLHALSVSQQVMRNAGFNPKLYRWSISRNQYTYVATVTATPTFSGYQLLSDGTTGDTSWRFEVAPFGKVTRAYGALAPVASLGRYPIISARSAVDRLNYSRYLTRLPSPADAATAVTGSSTWHSDGLALNLQSSNGSPSPKPTLPTAPPAGSKLSWPLATVTIVKATLGVASYRQSNGAIVVLPSYTLTASNGARYLVLAVGTSALNSSP
jgi:hypothetical protein